MLMKEIVNEGDLGIKTGINAVKSLFKSKPTTPAAKPVDNAAAIRADQDARMNALGRGRQLAPQFKQGDVVNVDLRAYKNQPHFAMSKDFPFKGTDSEIARVIEIIPHPVSKGSFLAKLEVAAAKPGSERVMYKGQQVGTKTVTPAPTQITIPLEFISKRAP